METLPANQRRERAGQLAALAEAVTATGDLATALDLAERIPIATWRAHVLAGLTHFVEPLHGRRLMARALAMGDWNSVLADLLRLAPETLPVLTDTLLEWERTGVNPNDSHRRI